MLKDNDDTGFFYVRCGEGWYAIPRRIEGLRKTLEDRGFVTKDRI